jgi:hypothetical protein
MTTKEQLIGADQKTKDLAYFVDWIKTVPREDLERSLIDGFWKGQLDESELKRFFECERRTDAKMFVRKTLSKQNKLYKKWKEEQA